MKNPSFRHFSMLTRLRRLRRDNRGTAVLEMTILTPVLLTIGLGVMEMGNLVYKRHMIENGIRDAARYLAGVDCDNKKTAGKNLAETATIDGSGSERVEGWVLPIGNIDCADVGASYGGVNLRRTGGVMKVVKIHTSVSYSQIDLGFLDVLVNWGVPFNTLSFPVSHEERYYGGR